jgi:hypothetical protein
MEERGTEHLLHNHEISSPASKDPASELRPVSIQRRSHQNKTVLYGPFSLCLILGFPKSFYPIRISAGLPSSLTEIYRWFPQSLQAHPGVAASNRPGRLP